jgi:hypothetical protein
MCGCRGQNQQVIKKAGPTARDISIQKQGGKNQLKALNESSTEKLRLESSKRKLRQSLKLL